MIEHKNKRARNWAIGALCAVAGPALAQTAPAEATPAPAGRRRTPTEVSVLVLNLARRNRLKLFNLDFELVQKPPELVQKLGQPIETIHPDLFARFSRRTSALASPATRACLVSAPSA